MSMTEEKAETRRDFAAEAAEATAALQGDRTESVYSLREIEEAWARSLLRLGAKADLAQAVASRVERGLIRTSAKKHQRVEDLASAREAAAHLARAERWQWEIGTWSTGAGEGRVSMGEVRTLQVARAWLSAGLAREELALARELANEVEADSNGMGKPHAKGLRALRAALMKL
jgi:hypothetical protein